MDNACYLEDHHSSLLQTCATGVPTKAQPKLNCPVTMRACVHYMRALISRLRIQNCYDIFLGSGTQHRSGIVVFRHPNTQVPGNKGRWPLGLRELGAHQVLEHSDICYLGFLLRVLTGALLLARVNGGWKPWATCVNCQNWCSGSALALLGVIFPSGNPSEWLQDNHPQGCSHVRCIYFFFQRNHIFI